MITLYHALQVISPLVYQIYHGLPKYKMQKVVIIIKVIGVTIILQLQYVANIAVRKRAAAYHNTCTATPNY
jgi:hypothetical protein